MQGSGTGNGSWNVRRLQRGVRISGGGRVSWDEVREWHGHIYTTKCKIDS